MAAKQLLLSLGLLIVASRSTAFEADVHYGLTHWLALQAGFEPQAAQTIATGDERVDSGDMQYIDLVAIYACLGTDETGARRAGEHHYPSAGTVPGAPETRTVSPGSDAARKAAHAVIKVPASQAPFMLLKLGEALHILQDSWSHQGVPDVPSLEGGAPFVCDAKLAWGHPKSRGGAASHRADLTMHWPADTVAMAKATYEVLTQYPPVSATKRTARNWDEIRPELDSFIKGSTKTDKARWFTTHGVSDVSFLEGISLPDGGKAFVQQWPGRKLPPLASPKSRQHAVDAELLDFFNRFFEAWVTTNDFEALASQFGVDASETKSANAQGGKSELVARLRVWRLRDHGRAAELAHALRPLSANERRTIQKLAAAPNALAHYAQPGDAFFPILPRGKDVSPLLPFYVATATAAGTGPKAVAVTKFRHVPYDTVVVVAQKIRNRWAVTSVGAIVDH